MFTESEQKILQVQFETKFQEFMTKNPQELLCYYLALNDTYSHKAIEKTFEEQHKIMLLLEEIADYLVEKDPKRILADHT